MTKTMLKLHSANAQGATGTGGNDAPFDGAAGTKIESNVAPIVKPTSDTLVELENKLKAAMVSIVAEKDFDKQQVLMLDAMAIKNDIKTEIARINAQAIAQANAEKINARVAMADNLRDASAAYAVLNADKKSTEEQRNAALDALNLAYDLVKTELLARYATSKPATVKTEGGTGTKGATGTTIIALHEANLAAGMTPTESKKAIEAAGHSRGTTGAVVLAWEKTNGIK